MTHRVRGGSGELAEGGRELYGRDVQAVVTPGLAEDGFEAGRRRFDVAARSRNRARAFVLKQVETLHDMSTFARVIHNRNDVDEALPPYIVVLKSPPRYT